MKKLLILVLALALVVSASTPVFAEPDSYALGDFDGNGSVTSDDAVYLLRYTLFPDAYPIEG